MTPHLVEILAPPTIAQKGRFGCFRVSPRKAISFSKSKPAAALSGKYLAIV
jgi:hypothetical protein